MIINKKLLYCFVILLLFILHCSEAGSDVTGSNIAGESSGFYLEHQDGLVFTIQAKNALDVKYFQFYIKFDNSILTFSNFASTIGDPFLSIEDSAGVFFAFDPTTALSGNLQVLTLTFSGSNYNDTKINIEDLYSLNSSDDIIEDLNNGNICYLDEGIIIQAEQNTLESMSAWMPTGNYVWSERYCGYME